MGQNTTRLLVCAGDFMIGYLLLRQASVAMMRLDQGNASPADRAFYRGKLAAARFFTHDVLPQLDAHRKIVEATDNDLMDVSEEEF